MSDVVIYILVGAAAAVGAFIAAWIMAHRVGEKNVNAAREEARRIVVEGQKEAEIRKKEAVLEAREAWYKEKSEFDRDMDKKSREIERRQKQVEDESSALQKKVETIEGRIAEMDRRDDNLQGREKGIELREKELEDTINLQNEQLQKIARMTPEEAKQLLMDNMLSQAKMEAAAHIKKVKEEAETQAEREAKEVIIQSIFRCAADHTVETTVSVVNLPADEMKGRIIGREGRNIRAFETLTGIDVIVDDTPEAVILSGYDPVRREVARIALEKLIQDGRIHPTRIEEVVEKSQREMEVIVRETGEQACFELGIHGLHPEVIKLLGKLNYRTSYGQNVLAHSKEVAILCGIMAAELKLDAVLAKRCGLLHDIGKAIDRETEGTHTQIGADFMGRFNEREEVVNSIESHHGDVPILSPYPVLVQTADAVSGSRPGARREPLEAYVKRLKQLEDLADSFRGVSKAYAIQAGREIRVIVENAMVDDLAAEIMAGDIASKIESEMQYPGQVKVTVIRESRSTEFAR